MLAEAGARKALEALAMHEPDPYKHMDEAQRDLRCKLRAQARQMGDRESQTRRGAYEIKHLVEKLAYDQWHRLLFARFLLENDLLISPEHGVSVSLYDCEELSPSLGLKDAWAVAARFAAVELPEIFRADDPAGGVELPVEDRKGLIQLVTGLPVEVFTASDSLGWCYQFWQAERKAQVNAAGNKVGADELPAVTQLFTEDYMVDFLLDNTLGAWWAGKKLTAEIAENAEFKSEEEVRQFCALPGCQWKYLRFIKSESVSASSAISAVKSSWLPAAGTFDGWPTTAKEIKCLDPCMGSGHFVVAMFERLVALRLAEEDLDEAAAVAAVIHDNLFGLEIDPRCTQIGAFNLALAAWRRLGHCKLPAMNLACSGLAPNTREADWLAIAGDDEKLRNGMERLYRLFQQAAVLGSLINPRSAEGDLLEAGFHELQPLLEKALAQETKDDTAHEMAVTARGLAKAAEILAGQFTLVATNVPYVGFKKQHPVLADYTERYADDAKHNLATVFVQRCLNFSSSAGTTAVVTQQNFLFLGSYKALRERLLETTSLQLIAPLGAKAFVTPMWDFSVCLAVLSKGAPKEDVEICGIDAASVTTIEEKSKRLRDAVCQVAMQSAQKENPDCRITFSTSSGERLEKYAFAMRGIVAGDLDFWNRNFWEVPVTGSHWRFLQTTFKNQSHYAGRTLAINWSTEGQGMLRPGTRNRAYGCNGVAVCRMGEIKASLYSGDLYDQNVATVVPISPNHLPAIWSYCSSKQYEADLREIDQKLNITNATLVTVPFDLAHWEKVAAEKYPHGLPKPFSSDPTQWLFDGKVARPSREVARPSRSGFSEEPDRDGLATGLATLNVAVARLLGYQWPRQTGSSFPDCPALGPDGLETLADDDGIVPISPAKGEAAAAERLRELLARAFGEDWNATQQEELLAQAGYAGASLEDWLRNGFFEQHCKLFHNRPFIWHIWDGLKNGFSVLVNYHKLTYANLEKLTYSYLGDRIRRQQAAVAAEEAGSDARLQAARQLQATLKLILEGEPPYDLFVRWKPLSQQAIGWHPDLNDGVRMNIRPFMKAPDVGKKGAGILRVKPNIKWEKDRGKEPARDKAEFPWFWGWDGVTQDFTGVGKEPDGNRWNGCHYSNSVKQAARTSAT